MTRFFNIVLRMRNRHYLLFDLVVMLVVPYCSLILRMDATEVYAEYGLSLILYTLLSIGIKLSIYYPLGMYRHLWKYASIEEVGTIVISVLTAGFVFSFVYLVVLPFIPVVPQYIPRSVPFIDLLLSMSIHGGVRLISRLLSTELRRKVQIPGKGKVRRVLIVGAGNSGTMIAKEIMRDPGTGFEPVGFIDDDPRKQHAYVSGLPIFGTRDVIPDIVRAYEVSQVLIAMPSATGEAIQAILAITEPLKVTTRTLPSVSELVGDTVAVRQFREIRIDDLLRRDPVKIDMNSVRDQLENKRVLVTGAGGSIGSEICRHVAQCDPAELYLLGHGENSIHAISEELKRRFPSLIFHTVIADIRDAERLTEVFTRFSPEVVFHAAAHKHVPLMEVNPIEALTNNVLGTINVLRHARTHGVKHLTLISTDKAVSPRSIMGVTKRLGEIALQLCAMETDHHYVAVRFGNVLGSRGSVVPIFLRQIEAGGPITITHPEMRRYFMTIPEAVQLVLQASTFNGNGGVYVLDMGRPVRIVDLAMDLIRLSGKIPHKDVDIVFTGLRAGEKLSEHLFRDDEVYRRSKHEKIYYASDPVFTTHAGNGTPTLRNLDAFEDFVRTQLVPALDQSIEDYVHRIQTIVPDFTYEGVGEIAE
ncbi:MAG: nucleoside-diphosphate sugar epimerase/dehydratase [Bacteroidota bacterium]